MVRNAAKFLIPAQAAGALLALLALTLWPPASGDMMLVPIGGGDANAAAKAALAGGARLLAAGPFAGSLVVIGDRASIARQIRSWNMVIMAAPPAGCGASGGIART